MDEGHNSFHRPKKRLTNTHYVFRCCKKKQNTGIQLENQYVIGTKCVECRNINKGGMYNLKHDCDQSDDNNNTGKSKTAEGITPLCPAKIAYHKKMSALQSEARLETLILQQHVSFKTAEGITCTRVQSEARFATNQETTTRESQAQQKGYLCLCALQRLPYHNTNELTLKHDWKHLLYNNLAQDWDQPGDNNTGESRAEEMMLLNPAQHLGGDSGRRVAGG